MAGYDVAPGVSANDNHTTSSARGVPAVRRHRAWRGGPCALHLSAQHPGGPGRLLRGLLRFVEAAESKIDALHSFMLVRHGHVVAEGWWSPYAADEPHVLFSLSKSFTSTAVGLAVAEGKLSVDDLVLEVLP